MPDVAARLRALRKQRGITLEVLAGLSGVSISYLSMVENGNRTLNTYSTIVGIASALDVPPAELAPGMPGGLAASGAALGLVPSEVGRQPLPLLPGWARRLTELRRARVWSPADLACELKKIRADLPSVKSLRHMIQMDWESGRHRPGPRYRLLLAAVYDADEQDIFGDGELVADALDADGLHITADRFTPDSRRSDEHDFRAPGNNGLPNWASEGAEDIPILMAWITDTNTSDDAIEQIARASVYLAEVHAQIPAKRVLSEVLQIHRQAQTRLRSGKQRLRQTRELLRIDSDLLAHACLLLGDLGQNRKASKYGIAALLLAQEAGVDEAIAWSVQAKTARWEERYVESAELARRGFEVSALTASQIELAYREANAIALFGDASRAQEALKRAERAAETLPADGGRSASVWSFPVERQAVFAMSVAIHTGDPEAALRAAAMADVGWAAGDPKVPATWAQIRAGSGIAYLMKDSLDGAIQEIIPLMDLPQDLRIDTVIGYLHKLDRLLMQARFVKSPAAIELRRKIQEFNSAASLDEHALESR